MVVTDSGEEKAEFILSFSAYAKLAKPLMVAKLVAQGEVDIEYQRVPCKYATGAHLLVKVHESSKFPNYLAILLLNQGGLSDITAIEVWEVYFQLYQIFQKFEWSNIVSEDAYAADPNYVYIFNKKIQNVYIYCIHLSIVHIFISQNHALCHLLYLDY